MEKPKENSNVYLDYKNKHYCKIEPGLITSQEATIATIKAAEYTKNLFIKYMKEGNPVSNE